MEGRNACLLFFGPGDSGKTYTLRGKTGVERGILARSIEDIFNIVRNSEEESYIDEQEGPDVMFLKVGMYSVLVDRIVDLLRGQSKQKVGIKDYLKFGVQSSAFWMDCWEWQAL